MYHIQATESEAVSAYHLDIPLESFGFQLRSEATGRECAVFDGLRPSQQQGPRVRGIHVPSVHYLTGISPSVASMISFQAFQSFQRQTAACTLIFSTDSVRFPADLRLNSRHRMASTRIANLPNVPHTMKDIERQQPKPQQAALVTFAQQFINALHSESKLTSTAGSTSVCEPQGVVLCTPAGKIWMLALQLPHRCYDRRQSRNRRG